MEQKRCWHGNKEVLHRLNMLPRKIMAMQDKHNIVEFVIHELCNDDCFNITKAAYIIDNPDFDCMRGIAGYCKDERYNKNDIWTFQDDFSEHMAKSAFNQKVRSLQRYSGKRRNEDRAHVLQNVAEELGMKQYGCCDIKMKHDNHGFLLYEGGAIDDEKEHESFLDGICLLSFCPIY